MYKNGWQFTTGSPLLWRMLVLLDVSTLANFTPVVASLPDATNAIGSVANFHPGACTKILVDTSYANTGVLTPAIIGIVPGYEGHVTTYGT